MKQVSLAASPAQDVQRLYSVFVSELGGFGESKEALKIMHRIALLFFGWGRKSKKPANIHFAGFLLKLV